MRRLILAALLATPFLSAEAQTLYRCVQKGKPTSYQNTPCPAAAKTASSVEYVPDRNVPVARTAPSSSTSYRRQSTNAVLHNIPRASSPSACESAKRQREIMLGSNNQGGNVDVRRVLNDAVARACN